MNPQQPFDPNQNQSQQPVQQPEIYNSPTLAPMPYGSQAPPQPQTSINDPEPPKSRKGLIVAGIAAGVIILLLITAAIIGSNNSKQAANTGTEEAAGTSQILEPASSIELQQTDNALSQDISGLDDEKDFPSASLDDKTLGL